MGLLDIASIRSIERGFNYYQSECVINLKSFSETQHEAEVKGSGNKVYRCYIDMEHPRKSKCNCPHADGRRVICKHMIALLFTASPEAANKHMGCFYLYDFKTLQIACALLLMCLILSSFNIACVYASDGPIK